MTAQKYKLKMVKMSDIVFEGRARKDYGNVQELADSIAEQGFVQPVCIRAGDMKLMAGGRRYKAAELLGLKEVPALLRDGIDDADLKEIELVENIHRKDMSWQEKARLINDIHSLYCEKNLNWSGRKTAKVIDQSPMSVSRYIRVAAALEALPELEQCENAEEVLSLLNKGEELQAQGDLYDNPSTPTQLRLDNRESGEREGSKEPDVSATISYTKKRLHGPFSEESRKLSSGKGATFIDCDPPAGERIDPAGLAETIEELYRIAGPTCWMTYWYTPSKYSEVLPILKAAGWQVDPTPCIWMTGEKVTTSPITELSHTYQTFLLCRKGKPTLLKECRNSWMRPTPGHQEKPAALLTDIMDAFCEGPAETCLIPYADDGHSILSCLRQGIDFQAFCEPESQKELLEKVKEDTVKFIKKG